ncbi:MAG: ATP synthase subunit I [Gammaproteobacteria bacterium]|nr:ATP synthase subunit I [Gammaproteobacteria bacterium]
MRRLREGPENPSPDRDKPLTNYDFALARRQALMLVAGQAAITAAVALVCAASSGVPAAIAAAIGGAIGTVATFVQVASGFRRSAVGDARAIARGFYRGEALKIAVTVVLFVLALHGRHFAPGPMLAGYVATFVAYWVALARLLRAR